MPVERVSPASAGSDLGMQRGVEIIELITAALTYVQHRRCMLLAPDQS
jgi:hypothetical protein